MYKIIGADQKEYGPVSASQIRQWISDGRLSRQSPVQGEGSAEWKPLGTIPEFAGLFPPTAGPAALSPGAGAGARTSGLAVASLVLGVLGVFSCGATALIGLILGIVSLVKINRSEGRLSGNGLAIAGICVSGIFLLMLPIGAAMLLPALAKAKAKAQTINCVNNVKQLGLAVRMYANDNNDKLPSTAAWCDSIQRYTGSPRVFQCPADPGRRSAYAFNARLEGKKIGEVNPQTVMIFDSNAGWNGAGGPELLASGRHSPVVVVGLANGSVQQVSRSQINTLRWDP